MKFWQFAMLMSAVYIAPTMTDDYRFGAGAGWFLMVLVDLFVELRRK